MGVANLLLDLLIQSLDLSLLYLLLVLHKLPPSGVYHLQLLHLHLPLHCLQSERVRGRRRRRRRRRRWWKSMKKEDGKIGRVGKKGDLEMYV